MWFKGAMYEGGNKANAWRVYLILHLGMVVQIPLVGVPLCLTASLMCYAAQFYFVTNFSSTFRVRGCGKNGSTVAVRQTCV